MTEAIKLIIDGNSVTVPPGTTILSAAAELGTEIPT
ncbi:MAG: (2Fe-2S)-binding protein, partial [Chloroflexi bacterium]|nr:(2Fe-2S)-binding protein [Chloroflexota bacterium]